MAETITITFTPASPAPTDGYVLKYREVGVSSWTTVGPNPTGSPVSIPVPEGKSWEGTIQSDCGTGLSSTVPWAVASSFYACSRAISIAATADSDFDCNAYYNNGSSDITDVYHVDCDGNVHEHVTVSPGSSICSRQVPSGGDSGYLVSIGPC